MEQFAEMLNHKSPFSGIASAGGLHHVLNSGKASLNNPYSKSSRPAAENPLVHAKVNFTKDQLRSDLAALSQVSSIDSMITALQNKRKAVRQELNTNLSVADIKTVIEMIEEDEKNANTQTI
jgi:hypothetical protein